MRGSEQIGLSVRHGLKVKKGKERDAYAMRGQSAIILWIRRMKELVLQLSLLGNSPAFFFPLPGTFPAGQGAPRLHVQGDRNLDGLLSIPCLLA